MPEQPLGVCVIGSLDRGRGTDVPSNADALIRHLGPAGVEFVCASTRREPVARLADIVLTMIGHRRRYSVVLVNVFSGRAFRWAVVAGRLSKLLDRSLVLWLHGGGLPEHYSHPGFRKQVDRLFRRADRIVAPSGYLADAFRRAGYTVDVIPYDVPVVSGYSFQRRASCRPRLLWLRAFHSVYNPLLAVRTMARLRGTHPDARLLMCGPMTDAALLGMIRDEAVRLGVEACIELRGRIGKEEFKREGLAHDIFLNTPRLDNTPVSVIEGLAMGLCVASTKVGGIPYLLTHEHDAMLVPPDDPEAMADAVRRLLTEPGLAARVSENGRKTAEGFDLAVVLPRWQALLREVAESRAT